MQASVQQVNLRRLYWVGPATIVVSVLAVCIVQRILLALLPPLPPFSGSVLNSNEPAIATAILVTGAILMFPIVVDSSSNPLQSFRRLAFGVLLVSCLPNLPLTGDVDVGKLALMVLHVVAWSVAVTMLTRLTVTTRESGQGESWDC